MSSYKIKPTYPIGSIICARVVIILSCLVLIVLLQRPLWAEASKQSATVPLVGEKTIVLVNYSQMWQEYGANGVVPLLVKLNNFVSHPAVDGTVVFVDEDPTFSVVWSQWLADPADLSRAIAASGAVHDLIGSQSTNATEYIILVGGDNHIPYRRIDANLDPPASPYDKVPLGSPIGAAFLNNQILTDDFYADPQGLSQGPPFEPMLGVGRLVETPTEIIAALNHFLLSDGQITLGTALTAGYGPMVDSAENSCNLFAWDQLLADCDLIGEDWLPSELDAKLVEQMPNLLMVYARADHGSINVGGATEAQALLAERATAWTIPISGTLAYFPVSNHAGLNAPTDATPPIDWAQMWLSRGAAFIGNTSNGLVSSVNIDYSEKLGQHFLEQIVGGESIGLAEALNGAKASHRDEFTLLEGVFGEVHQKVVAQTVLYGIPMTQIVSPHGDAFEVAGDDSCEQAPPLLIGESQLHSFHVAGDIDWLKVSATEGDSLQLNLIELGDSFAQSTVYNGCGSGAIEIASSGANSTWQVSTTGDYYIETRAALSGIHGSGVGYTLSLSAGHTLLLPLISR